ncbi:hypothetical protein H6G80_28415 [Nostoc sp. FACHB-87]|uniref:hypothetical protein n=1 Tax=Nostocaceae TaxID=1162 RepID=UPI0016847647|nr:MULTISPECIES: hypothetical protein [Nostocaceae]MBD2457976.1 hypothetical protein [Nostoc sp. FACHB-87]MBD2479247.1 hypothetical protein [Anabaena sp. FACHB-83]
MPYPVSLTFKVLESCHEEYLYTADTLRRIDLLTAGGHKLEKNIEEFLPQRPGEENVVYEARRRKYNYLNLLGSAINQQVAKLSSAALSVSGIGEEPFWEEFREDTDRAGRSERDLLSYVFAELLKFKKIYLHVDKPRASATPLNRAQEQSLGLRPYVVAYSPFQVTNWHEEAGKLQWIKIRQIVTAQPDPTKEPQTIARWVFIDNTSIATYSAVVKLRGGEIEELNGKGVNDDTPVALQPEVLHGLGEIPVIKLEIPDTLWVADQAYPKALEHLKTEHTRHDMLTLAYFQRTYKKVQIPDQDLDETYSDVEPIKTGLQHVLELEDFKWNEPNGGIIEHINNTLQSIKDEVRDLVSLGGGSTTNEAVRQSGESKAMDFVKQEAILRQYGSILTQGYQILLQMVAKSAGIANPELISVTGFQNFETDTLESLITKVTELSGIDFATLANNLPPTAYKLVYSQLVSLLVGNLSAEQQQVINAEIEARITSPA